MPCKSFLTVVLAAAVLPALGSAQGPKGPKVKDSFKLSPDTVYFTKTGTETTLVRTVNLHRVGPPSGAIQFSAVASTDSVGNWLAVSPATGSIPTDLVLTATPGTLGPGIYTGKVTVTPVGDGSAQTLKAVLRVLTGPAGAPAAFVRPLSLNFHMVYGGANPDPRLLTVSSPTGGATFTWGAAPTVLNPLGGNWLSIAPTSGTGPGLIIVTVNGAGLNPGLYRANILVVSSTTTTQIPVTLEVRPSAPANLVINPRAFNFIVHPGGPVPASRTLRVKNTGSGTLNWTAATSGGDWLSIEPLAGTTPGEIKLSVKLEGLGPGHHAGSVAVTAGGRTETARVFLRILGPAVPSPTPVVSPSAVQITPGALEFCLCGGVLTPLSAAVQLTSQVPGLNFTAQTSTAAGGDWLKINPPTGAIPGVIAVTAAPSNLAAGVYTGLISISITGQVTEQRSVPVTLKVSPQAVLPWLATRPGAIAFQAVRGGANPAAQQVSLDAHGAASIPYKATVTVTTQVNWLAVSPDTGSAPRSVTVSVNTAGLAAGLYAGAIVFQATGTPAALPATLNVFLQVLAPPSVSPLNARSAATQSGGLLGFFLEPASEFLATAGSPQSVLVALKSADGKPLAGAAVEVTPSTGDPAFMLEYAGGGLYSGMFHSLAAGPVGLTATAVTGAGATTTFGVGGDLDGGPDVPLIFSGGIVNAANYAPAPTPLVPGALASLFGWNLVDASVAASALPLPRELAGVKVLVGGVEAPLISLTAGQEADQINFQVPVEAGVWSYADVVVLSGGVFSAPEGIATAPAVPALFTRNRQGTGVLAALHNDFTEITPERPARVGAMVLLYATALGEVSPAQQSGRAPGALSRLVAPARVLIAGRAARADFIGLAPGYPGLYQINVTVPDGTPPGDAAVEIIVDGVGSGGGVVIPIR